MSQNGNTPDKGRFKYQPSQPGSVQGSAVWPSLGGLPLKNEPTRAYGNARSEIKVTTATFGQAQAFSLGISHAFGQANADIVTTYVQFGQAFALTLVTFQQSAQAYSHIKQQAYEFGQAEASIHATVFLCAQAQADIQVTTQVFAQAQTSIEILTNNFAQAHAQIKVRGNTEFAQAEVWIKVRNNREFAQAEGWILRTYRVFGLAQAQIQTTYYTFAQAKAQIQTTYYTFAQTQTRVKQTYQDFAQTQAQIKVRGNVEFAQAEAQIQTIARNVALAQSQIQTTYYTFAQAQTQVQTTYYTFAQAQSIVSTTVQSSAQAEAQIILIVQAQAQAEASIIIVITEWQTFAQAQAQIVAQIQEYAQAEAQVILIVAQSAQAEAYIIATYQNFAQAEAYILTAAVERQEYAQAEATIIYVIQEFAQAEANIILTLQASACVMAYISPGMGFMYGQANARIIYGVFNHAQALAYIKGRPREFGQADAYITDAKDQRVYGLAQGDITTTTPVAYAQALVIGFTDLRANALDFGIIAPVEFSQSPNLFTASYDDPIDYINEGMPTGWAKITISNTQNVQNVYISSQSSSDFPIYDYTYINPYLNQTNLGHDTLFVIYDENLVPLFDADDQRYHSTPHRGSDYRAILTATLSPGTYWLLYSNWDGADASIRRDFVEETYTYTYYYDYNNEGFIRLGFTLSLGSPATFAQAGALIDSIIKIAPDGYAQATIVRPDAQANAMAFIDTRMPVGYAAAIIVRKTIDIPAFAQARVVIQIAIYGLAFLDTFTRTTTAPPFAVGNADTGTPWIWNKYDTSWSQATTPIYVNGSELRLPSPAQNFDTMSNTGATTGSGDGEFLIDIWVAAAGDNGQYIRWYDTNWYIRTRTYSDTNFLVSGSTGTSYYWPITTRSAWYRLRVIISSTDAVNRIKAHFWKIGDTEPITWSTIQTAWPSNNLGGTPAALLDIYESNSGEPTRIDNITVYSTYYTVYNQGEGNAMASITAIQQTFGQAQASLNQAQNTGQSQASILTTYQKYGQAQAKILKSTGMGQAQGRIIVTIYPEDTYAYLVKGDGAASYWPLDSTSSGERDIIGFQQLTRGVYFDSNYQVAGVNPPTQKALEFYYYYAYMEATGSQLVRFKGSQWTSEFWVRFGTVSSGRRYLFSIGSDDGQYLTVGRAGATVGTSGIALNVYHYYSGTNHALTTGITTDITTWYHIVLVSDNSTYKLYINNILTTEWSAPVTTWTRANLGGGDYSYSYGTYEYPVTRIDGWAAYDTLLTPEQINRHYVVGGGPRYAFGQARPKIRRADTGYPFQATASAAFFPFNPNLAPGEFNKYLIYGQAEADILAVIQNVARAQARIRVDGVKRFAQAAAHIQPRNGLLAGTWVGGQTNYAAIGAWYSEHDENNPNYASYAALPPSYTVNDSWGMSWTGTFVADVTGPWAFGSTTDDGSKVVISGPAITSATVTGNFTTSGTVATMNANFGGGQGETYREGTVTLVAGELYTIQAIAGQGSGAWAFRFYYRRPPEAVNVISFPVGGTATYTASSYYSSNYYPAYAADGNWADGWAAAGYVPGAWWQVDWTVPQTLTSVYIKALPYSNHQFGIGRILFSDGSSYPVTYPTPENTITKYTVDVTNVTWMRLISDSGGNANPGFSEVSGTPNPTTLNNFLTNANPPWIEYPHHKYQRAHAQAYITDAKDVQRYGQSLAYIGHFQKAQAQAYIQLHPFAFGLAGAQVGSWNFGQAVAQISYDVLGYRKTVLADRPVLYFPLDELEHYNITSQVNFVRFPVSGIATYTAYNSYNSGYLPANAADGTPSEWASLGYTAGEWWQVDWTVPQTFKYAYVKNRASWWFGVGRILLSTGESFNVTYPSASSGEAAWVVNAINVTWMRFISDSSGTNDPGFTEVGAYNTYPLDTGLTSLVGRTHAYWNSSGATFQVTGGSSNAGTAITFNDHKAESNGIDTVFPDTLGAPITVEFWMKWNGSNDEMVFTIGTPSSYTSLVFWSNILGFNTGNADMWGKAWAGLDVANKWVHVAAVMYNRQIASNKIYINGVQLTSLSQSGSPRVFDFTQFFTIGGRSLDGNYLWSGGLDEFAIFNYELTGAQILAHFNSRINIQIAQAQAYISPAFNQPQFGQAQTYIGHFQKAQAQARMLAFGFPQYGQSNALISRNGEGLVRVVWENVSLGTPGAYANGPENWVAWGIEDEIEAPNYATGGNLIPGFGGTDGGAAWTARFIADADGTWQFKVNVDDGGDLWIDSTRVVNAGWPTRYGGEAAFTGSIDLISGQEYNLHARFAEGNPPYAIRIYYKRPADGAWYLLTDNSPPWLLHAKQRRYAQAKAFILAMPHVYEFGQAQAQALGRGRAYAQAMVYISPAFNQPVFGQARAFIGHFQSGQAQARMIAFGVTGFGQAQARVWRPAGWANAQADILATDTKFGLARARIIGPSAKANASASIKQTYPFMGSDINYALVENGATATDSLGDTVTPGYTIDGYVFGPPWEVVGAYDPDDGGAWLQIDLGQDRNVDYFRINPYKYDTVVSVQYRVYATWITLEAGIQFNVGIFEGIDVTRAELRYISPVSARYWRILVTGAGSYNGISILTFELGQASIKGATFAQALAFLGWIKLAQAQAYISPGFGWKRGQAQARIVNTYQNYGQAQSWVIPPTVIGQANANILVTSQVFAQAESWVIPPTVIGNAQAHIHAYNILKFAQARTRIYLIKPKVAQAAGLITTPFGMGQAQALTTRYDVRAIAFANAYIIQSYGHGQAEATIRTPGRSSGQASVEILRTFSKVAQARAFMKVPPTGQAMAYIIQVYTSSGNAQAMMNRHGIFGLALGTVRHIYSNNAQAQADIKQVYQSSAQSGTLILTLGLTVSAQAAARIVGQHRPVGQAMAWIGFHKFGLAVAHIKAYNVPKFGLAAGYILATMQPPPIPSSDYYTYLARFNDHDIPGYAQSESFASPMRIQTNYSAYGDTSLSEYQGLENKEISLTMRLWEETYQLCKDKVRIAATIFRSARGFAPLYVQQYDKYYTVLAKSLTVEKSVGSSNRILDYSIVFEAKPWLTSNDPYTISGTGAVSTVGRTLADGGWTPATLVVSGTDISITGTTATGQPTGTIIITGTVTDLVIDTEAFTALEGGVNRMSMLNKDFSMYVGPGVTNYTITGATACTIQWRNRWYL